MEMNFWFFGKTDIGAKRETNQDSVLYLSGQIEENQVGLAVVADGMGGLSDGELASQEVVKGFERWWYEQMPNCLEQENIWKALSDSIEQCITFINWQVYQMGIQNNCKMGTTLSMAFILNDQILIKNIGDSRGYHVRDHSLIQFTRDDSYQQKFRDEGYTEDDLIRNGIAQNILTKCIGIQSHVESDTQMMWLKNDMFLCTDGVYQYIDEDSLVEQLLKMDFNNYQKCFEEIKKKIYQNGAGDNWSCIYIKKMR